MSVITFGLPPVSVELRVVIAVVVFVVFILIMDKLIALFKVRASRRILEVAKKTEPTRKILDALLDLDDDLLATAKHLSVGNIAGELSNKNAFGLLELSGIHTENTSSRKLIIESLLGPIVWYSFRKREFLLEFAVLMDKNNAGLGRYDEMATRLRGIVQFRDSNVVNSVHEFLEWSYGINSLLLFCDRDISQSLAVLPVRARIGIQKLAYKREQMVNSLLINVVMRIGLIRGD